MAILSQSEIDEFLAEPLVCHLVTVRADGRPHVAPVWYVWQGGHALVMVGEGAIKVRNLRRNPAASVSIASPDRPYRYVVLEGEGIVTKENLSQVVRDICLRYDGPERGPIYAQELLSQDRMTLIDIRVNRVISWKGGD
ncbi:MAG: hypothetical protein BZY88_06320 [SAR202 cluster bacterium Io17-Chloro-G9]|nr:MAG: hypothetical protein BZY88_06320 [SAR202 cluster bacterium Io17-Chloro-G9]